MFTRADIQEFMRKQDNDAHLERLYKSTWMCSRCGRRHSFQVGTCDCPIEEKTHV